MARCLFFGGDMKLREYQTKGINGIREKFTKGHKRILFQLSTGGGKSLIFTHLAVESIKKGNSVLIVCDRWELMGQAKRHLKAHGINPIMIDPSWRGQTGSCYIASVQTLNRRVMPEAKIVMIDEAHKNAFKRILENHMYDSSYIVGFTATPISTPKFDLSKIYHDMVQVIEIDELISMGFLVNAKYFAAWENFGKIKMRGDDYDEAELLSKFDKRSMYDGMIDAYNEHTPNTKAICFCINVEHTLKTCQEFNDKGIKAVFVVSDPSLCSKEDRKRAFDEFENGDAMILVNQGIATTGYDCPKIQTVVLNRKTKSLALYLQMLGRGSRPYPNKEFFNVIDMGSNIIENGWYDDIRDWDLKPKRKASTKKGLAPIKECGNTACGCLIPAVAKVCKFCGYIFPDNEERLVTSEGIVEIKKEALPQIPPHLLKIGFSKMTIDELETIRSIKGYKLGWMIHHLSERGQQAFNDYAKLKGYKYGWEQHHKRSQSRHSS